MSLISHYFVLCSLPVLLICSTAEKMEEKEANNLMTLLEIVEDDDGLVKYMGKLRSINKHQMLGQVMIKQ